MVERLYVVTRADSVNVLEMLLPDTLDAVVFDRLNEAMHGIIDSRPGERWVLDLSQVTYTGSATLGLIVNIRQFARQAGATIVLCGMPRPLVEIFQACSLERLFIICRTRQEAIERAIR
jgi:anti-anti-sigma factor